MSFFNLDHSIALWRRSRESNRAFTPDDLDELEQHLRDQVAGLVARGFAEEEAFHQALAEMGDYGTAETEYRKVYWGKLVGRYGFLNELFYRRDMIKNYFRIALRNLVRQKGTSFIVIIGLMLGLVCCLVIFQYAAFEHSFDRFNDNGKALYRITETFVRDSEEPVTNGMSPWGMGPTLATEVPEVVRFARIHPDYSNPVISYKERPDHVFVETEAFYADPDFLSMFSYPLVSGENALSEANTMLLSESAARRYFGSENPVGKVLAVNGWIQGDFRVSGVFRDVPANSHLQFEVLMSMESQIREGYVDQPWWNRNFITYVQLRPDIDLNEVERKFTSVLLAHKGEEYRENKMVAHLNAQPLYDVHLNDTVWAANVVQGSYRTVSFFALIGLVVFLIALINYVNLATARALDRAREVGLRKSIGAQRGQLVIQFLFESALSNGLAMILAIAGAVLLLPVVNHLAGTQMTPTLATSLPFWMTCLVVFCAGTLLAGFYPAFVLSSFRPVTALRGRQETFGFRTWMRKGLVVVQFGASVAMVAGTLIVFNQLRYMQHMDLGIDLEQIVTVAGPRVLAEGLDQEQAINTLTQELRKIPGIGLIATSAKLPGTGFNWHMSARQKQADKSGGINATLVRIDTSFADLFGLQLIAVKDRRNLPGYAAEGAPLNVVVNESAARALGFNTPGDAIGQDVDLSGTDAHIVGVFKDFSWSSARQERENMFFQLSPGGLQVSLKVGTEQFPETLAAVEQTFRRLFPENPFSYTFADEQFDQQYRNDQRFATLFSVFAGLAIVIACLGLFGLASFMAEKRTKEIGVRKALGASVSGIVALLSKDFLWLVSLGFLLGSPVAYYVMRRWLDDFAHRIEMPVWVFLLSGCSMLIFALLTVSYKSLKAALANPTKSLRYE